MQQNTSHELAHTYFSLLSHSNSHTCKSVCMKMCAHTKSLHSGLSMHVEVTINREAFMKIIDELGLDEMSNSIYNKKMGGSAENLSKLTLNLDQMNLGDTLGREHSRFFV